MKYLELLQFYYFAIFIRSVQFSRKMLATHVNSGICLSIGLSSESI